MKRYDYWYWDKKISYKICQKIINLGKGNWNQAQTFGSRDENKSLDNIRKSDLVWINEQWVYDLIWSYMLSANEQAEWKYDIVAAQDCQVTRYTKGGFYTWHMDGLGSHGETYDVPNNKIIPFKSIFVVKQISTNSILLDYLYDYL